jgi:hypothetical protein
MVLYSEIQIWEKDIPEPTCGVCHGFSLRDVVKSGKYKKQPCVKPKKVVIEEQIPGDHLFHGPGVLTNKLLVEGWYHVVRAFADGVWTAKETFDYLYHMLCYNTKTIKKAIKEHLRAVRGCSMGRVGCSGRFVTRRD